MVDWICIAGQSTKKSLVLGFGNRKVEFKTFIRTLDVKMLALEPEWRRNGTSRVSSVSVWGAARLWWRIKTIISFISLLSSLFDIGSHVSIQILISFKKQKDRRAMGLWTSPGIIWNNLCLLSPRWANSAAGISSWWTSGMIWSFPWVCCCLEKRFKCLPNKVLFLH